MKSPDTAYIKKLMEFWEDLKKTVRAAITDKTLDGTKWTDEDDEMWDLALDLDRFLVRWFDPANVSDIRALPTELQQDAIVFLIERDAADAYDQIDGFLDLVILDGLDPQIVESCRPTDDGLQICEWISRNIPEKPETDPASRKVGSLMTKSEETEERIHVLEVRAGGENATHYLFILALCEIARQLSRIADATEKAHE